jgi:xanthine dehydrogenase accessory factor
MPDDWLRSKIVDQHTAVIALCHDPRIDDMALMEALNQDAFYIGAMGSERTSSKRRERLLSLDIAQSQIDRLHAPVGLPLGSKTPPEIAIAILAELTQLRASASKIA